MARRKGRTDSFYIHPLVHLWARERLSNEDKQRKAEHAFVLLGQAVQTEYNRPSGQWKYEARVMAHVGILQNTAVKYLQHEKRSVCERVWVNTQRWLVEALLHQGRWAEAEALGFRMLESCKRILGDEHPDTLDSMGNLATTYWSQGRLVEAEGLELQVLESRKRILGNEHPDTVLSMGNVAATYWHRGRWAEAGELGLRVLESRQRIVGNEHRDTVLSMGNLAATYRSQGRWAEAEELELQVPEAARRR